jgi:Domain of unknown function (DUF5916)/Carbohydrate family 9 binding domain-like
MARLIYDMRALQHPVSHTPDSGPRVRMTVLLLTVAALCTFPRDAASQSASEGSAPVAVTAPSRSVIIHPDAPAEPIAPEVVTRDSEGRATVRAVRVSQPLRIDGALDEVLYRDVRSISDFIQVEPDGGQAATERTETWVAFDDDYVYVSFKVWDSRMDTLIATEMRRDSTNSWQGNDLVSFIFDTFYDQRTSFTFTMNPLGGRSDGTMVNDRQYSSDWNPVWDMKAGRFDGGWAVEAAVPFKSLRYQPGAAQVWGFNAMRVKRSKNEISTLTLVPPARGQSGFQQAQFAATLVGIEAPRSGANLDIKPYAISNVTTDRIATPRVSNHPEAEAGLDVKYAVTQGLVADVTVNTDFAQVEADEQQINLTRFNLFFPEKRDFFLENQGTFSFGGVPINSAGGNFAGGFIGGTNAAPIMFYSRRIGLYQDHEVPLNVGGRLTGRAGKYSVGVLNIQTGDKEEEFGAPATNFSVVRAKRDVLRRSSIGLLFTNRSESTIGTGANRAYGIDGTFAFFENLQINAYWAGTDTEGLASRDDASYRGQLDYSGDRYTVQLEHLKIGDDFNPEVGFLRRDDMVREYARFKFSPRPRNRSAIRKYVYDAAIEYIEDGAGRLESRGGVRARVPERRSLQRQLHQFVRVPAGAVIDRRRRSAGRRLPVRHVPHWLQHQPAAGRLGQRDRGVRHLLQRSQEILQRDARTDADHESTVSGTDLYVQPRDTRAGEVGHPSGRVACDVLDDAADVRQRAAPVQLWNELGVDQCAVQMGVPARQRAVRRLQRGTQHLDATLSLPQQPRVHRQDQSTVSCVERFTSP